MTTPHRLAARPARPARPAVLLTVLVSALLSAGCEVGTGPGPTSDRAAGVAVRNTSNAHATGAARFLPDFSAATFPIEDIDLTAKADPMKAAVGLIRAAVGNDRAPRFEVKGVEASTSRDQAGKTVVLTTAALGCLQQKGAQELHAYQDSRYPYSMAIALVVKAGAYRKLDPAWCAIDSVIPYTGEPDPAAVPTIAPCVGRRQTGSALTLWVATTDAVCAVLGEPVAPVDRTLTKGDAGTDVARVQLALNDLGSKLTVDGRLGRATIVAVRAFEQCYTGGKTGPGVADASTLSDLSAAQSSGWSPDLC
jgi:hypothetical protein